MINNINFNLNKFLKNILIKKQYLKNLKKKMLTLNYLKQKNYKLLDSFVFKNKYSNPTISDNVVMYIIDITFSRSNTFLHVMDASGNLKFYCSAGHLDYKGKNKRVRFNVFKSIYFILITKLRFLKGKPIALHLKNVGFKRFWIVKKLKKKFFIKTIKIFNFFPFNGCRKKKVRRKKK